MNKMKNSTILLVLLIITQTHGAHLVFEFGLDDGPIIYSKDGMIPLLSYETVIDIPVPDDIIITYIKVTVDSLSPPKVDFMSQNKQVTIKYTWIQLTASTYNVIVKGIPI